MNEINCPECKGERLKKESLSVTVGGINIIDFTKFSISEALDFINNLKLTDIIFFCDSVIVHHCNRSFCKRIPSACLYSSLSDTQIFIGHNQIRIYS